MSAASEVVFDDADHSYRVGNTRWPSVTQILDPLMELEGIPRAALEAAAAFGQNIHTSINFHSRGTLDEDDLDEHLRPYLEAWKKFLHDTGAVVLESERLVSHPVLKIAGRLDSVIRLPQKNHRHVLDVKTSAQVHWSVALQTAAYREMLSVEELATNNGFNALEPLSKIRFCCHLLPDATYRLFTLRDYSRDWNSFVSAFNFHRLRTSPHSLRC